MENCSKRQAEYKRGIISYMECALAAAHWYGSIDIDDFNRAELRLIGGEIYPFDLAIPDLARTIQNKGI